MKFNDCFETQGFSEITAGEIIVKSLRGPLDIDVPVKLLLRLDVVEDEVAAAADAAEAWNDKKNNSST